MVENRLSLKNRGLVPNIQPEPDFWTCGFREVFDKVELVTYVKFQKILMSGRRDMKRYGQKRSKMPPKMEFFPHLRPPKIFFSKIGLCHFCKFMVPKLPAKQDKVYNEPQDKLFHGNLIIVTKKTKNGLIRTYFLINPRISRCENLKILSKYCTYHLLLSCTI